MNKMIGMILICQARVSRMYEYIYNESSNIAVMQTRLNGNKFRTYTSA
jgi:hypothetical protein